MVPGDHTTCVQRQHDKKRTQLRPRQQHTLVLGIEHLEFAEKRYVHASTVPRTADVRVDDDRSPLRRDQLRESMANGIRDLCVLHCLGDQD